jgi:hypothetical protein
MNDQYNILNLKKAGEKKAPENTYSNSESTTKSRESASKYNNSSYFHEIL